MRLCENDVNIRLYKTQDKCSPASMCVCPCPAFLVGWLYVVLSRVRTLEGLHTLVMLDPDPSKYKPRLNVIWEMERLRRIEQYTLQRVQKALDDPALASLLSSRLPHKILPLNPKPRPSKSKARPSKSWKEHVMEKCAWALTDSPDSKARQTVMDADSMQLLVFVPKQQRRDSVRHLCGPNWASLNQRNSCAIDTHYFCLFMWHTLWPNSQIQERPAGNVMERKIARRFQWSLAVFKAMLNRGAGQRQRSYLAWACAKRLYWQWLHELTDLYHQQYGDGLGLDSVYRK